jgi:hypothetical protein
LHDIAAYGYVPASPSGGGIVRSLLALAVLTLVALGNSDANAQATTWYWCDALHGYYPWVKFCPGGWRSVNGAMSLPQPYPGSTSAPAAVAAPIPNAPIHSGENIQDELSSWCEDAKKASSIVICADPDLRQMAMIRNKIFADAKTTLPSDVYKQLLSEQAQWVQSYSSSCGVPADGPEPSQPISGTIIDCYRREAFKRIVDLVVRLGQQKPGYRPTDLSSAQAGLVDQAMRQRADEEKAEQERQQAAAAEQAERERRQRETEEAEQRQKAKEELRRQAYDDLMQKLKDGGYKMEKPVELEIDWRDLMASAQKVAIKGNYVESNDMEGLMVSNNDLPLVRLYTDNASRNARILMLQCRNNNYSAASCEMIIAARVTSCVRHKGEINEKEVPCLEVEEAFTNPMADQ